MRAIWLPMANIGEIVTVNLSVIVNAIPSSAATAVFGKASAKMARIP